MARMRVVFVIDVVEDFFGCSIIAWCERLVESCEDVGMGTWVGMLSNRMNNPLGEFWNKGTLTAVIS